MSTLRKIERNVLRKKYGNRDLRKMFNARHKTKTKPRKSAFKRGIESIINIVKGAFKK